MRNKQILSLILVFCMLLAAMPAMAAVETGQIGDNVYYRYDNNARTLTITGTGDMYDFPNELQNWRTRVNTVTIAKGITSIGAYLLKDNYYVETITLPNTIRKIGDCAFKSCIYLEQVIIPSSVTEIGAEAFYYCPKLTSISLPGVKKLGNGAFYQTGLTQVPNLENVSELGERLFGGTQISEITWPSWSDTIPIGTFSYCEQLTHVIVPPHVKTLDQIAFAGCENLETISSNNVIEVSAGVFSDCKALREVDFPEVKYMSSSVFWGCTGLETYIVPLKVTILNDRCFYGCTRLKNITLSPSLQSISSGVFEGCSSLTEIILPNTVTFIGANAFNGCSLSSLIIPEKVKTLGRSSSTSTPIEFVEPNVVVKCISPTPPDNAVPADKLIVGWTPFSVAEEPKWTNAPVNNITVTEVDGTNPLLKTRWTSGKQDATYFKNGGGVDIKWLDQMTANDSITLYSLDVGGNETLKVVTADYVDKLAPDIAIAVDGAFVQLNVVDQ